VQVDENELLIKARGTIQALQAEYSAAQKCRDEMLAEVEVCSSRMHETSTFLQQISHQLCHFQLAYARGPGANKQSNVSEGAGL